MKLIAVLFWIAGAVLIVIAVIPIYSAWKQHGWDGADRETPIALAIAGLIALGIGGTLHKAGSGRLRR